MIKFNEDGSITIRQDHEVNEIFILIDLTDGTTHLREYPIGVCCECDGLCAPHQTMCDRCSYENDKIAEITYLELLFRDNGDIDLR